MDRDRGMIQVVQNRTRLEKLLVKVTCIIVAIIIVVRLRECMKFKNFKNLNDEYCEIFPVIGLEDDLQSDLSQISNFKRLGDNYCKNKNYPHFFTSDGNIITPIDNPARLGFNSCYYQPIYISTKNSFWLGNESFELSLITPTIISPQSEFIAVICKNKENPNTTALLDLFAFVPVKPQVESRIRELKAVPPENVKNGLQLNIIVVIFEGVSRSSFVRTMPRTHEFLEKGAFEMFGHTQTSDDTFTNVMAMLTGRNSSELEKLGCSPSHDKNLDGCPFIWKEFSPLGYRTSLAEDGGDSSPFNFLKAGFAHPPTDYFLYPFVKIMSKVFGGKSGCYGPRLQLEYLLDYLNKTVSSMANNDMSSSSVQTTRRKYFQTLISTMARSNNSRLVLMDESFHNTLEGLRSHSSWDHTALIFLSDQGSQQPSSSLQTRNKSWDSGTTQGNMSKRMWLRSGMPFLYIMLPKSFLTLYPTVALNLYNNRKQLTSHYDIYETLQHLKHIAVTGSPENFPTATSRPLFGQSLFTTFDKNRSCSDAGIGDRICPCGKLGKKLVDNPDFVDRKTFIEQASSYAMLILNLRLSHYPSCMYLLQRKVRDVRIYKVNEFMGILIEMTIQLEPVNAEVLAVMKYDRQGRFKLIGDFHRVGITDWEKFSIANSTCTRIDNYFIQSFCRCWI